MKLSGKVIRGSLARFQSRVGVDGLFRDYGDDLPLRSELFSGSQLESHAESLANWHQIDERSGADRLLARLADNERVLLEAYGLVTASVRSRHQISPASEWLLDNFYLIEEQIRTVRRHLPQRYSRGLPRLLNGPSAGYPLVYDLALELISHVDGHIDLDRLRAFVAAYQRKRPLTLGELWAVPIMFRKALIENLRRVASRIARATLARTAADQWSQRFIDCAEKTPHDLILLVADMARPHPPLSPAFVAEMARQLQGQSARFSVPLTWIEQRLAEHGQTIKELVQSESQQQAVDQVSISNSIGGLRELDTIEWRDFVESLSVVEQILRDDPHDTYRTMDFESRDSYRRVVEDLSKHSPLSEPDVARRAVELCGKQAAQSGPKSRTAHVGYFLVDSGLSVLERSVERYASITKSCWRLAEKKPLLGYLGAILSFAVLITLGILWGTGLSEIGDWVAGSLLFLSATQVGVYLVNWFSTLFVVPKRLPRLDYSGGIPAECATLVVVPTMLVSPGGIKHLLEGLETRYLANRDEQLRFCLLTDFRDARQETLPEDEALLQGVQAGIEMLNRKYPSGIEADRFYLFHRPRIWNHRQQSWMGHERKRGKLGDLNLFLRGGSSDAFSTVAGTNPLSLARIRYVITLDTDTILPRDAAQQLVGTLAHVLNRARIDDKRKVIVEGYGILQPGVATQLELEGQTWFAQLNSGQSGIDPYTRTISDVYQDLFSEGSFIGKGIYDVDAFVATMENRFPENQILSHDLLEGCYCRSGLVSDVHVYETYPARYITDISRRHRWIRGDWQIAPWLLPFVPGIDGATERNPLSRLSRWKILDNLRRSLVPIAMLCLLILGWAVWTPTWFWTVVVVSIILVPATCLSLISAARDKGERTLPQHVDQTIRSAFTSFAQGVLTLAFLPYEAYISLDAIFRTTWRMCFTRRLMLEWKTASDADRDGTRSLVGSFRSMAIAPTVAFLTAILLVVFRPDAITAAAPVLLMWLLSPWMAWRLSQPTRDHERPLTNAQVVFLHRVARKTWRFFETFMGPEDHWLPPDNYQEHPVGVLAHRTSPTNIGISLLSNLAAADFGYISVGRFLERTARTFATMEQLERYRGHFLNWYDTQTLLPLLPKYVSSVDSGNLSGHILTLRAGLLELPDQPIVAPGTWNSLEVTQLALESLGPSLPSSASNSTLWRYLLQLLDQGSHFRWAHPGLVVANDLLHQLTFVSTALRQVTMQGLPPAISMWIDELEQQCRCHAEDLQWLAPWLCHSEMSNEPIPEIENQSAWRLRYQKVVDHLDHATTLNSIIEITQRVLPALDELIGELTTEKSAEHRDDYDWLKTRREQVLLSQQRTLERLETIQQLATACGEFANVEYEFLYDASRRLLSIGFNVSDRQRDSSYYDLLASESRLASYVAIAQGKIKQNHWFALGRLLTTSNHQQMLLSWSGSMFEYLMPLLVMPTHRHTLLDQTVRAVVDRQQRYGKQRGVPWGISESGYNLTDAHQNYQYRAFGVPGLGFKRGLADDLVIAPYATTMALMVAPRAACENLQTMEAAGFSGEYGFFEAIDYTRTRVHRDHTHAVVHSYMAHHQGMSLLSLAYHLLNRPMQRRFAADPQFRATELLLQERIPQIGSFYPHASEATGDREPVDELQSQIRVFTTPNTPIPEVHLLSNGRYNVMVTNSGSGYSQWKGLSITRWREDATRDSTGQFCYLRDVVTGDVWSSAHQPTLVATQKYEAIFSQARAEFRRRDFDIKLHTEIAVSPEDDIEIRRLTLTNRSKISRTIELTSYAEVVLTSAAADATHPAFSNLFVQTELVPECQAILCTRRPRSHEEQPPWMLHLLSARGKLQGEVTYETDRSKFIGRQRNTTLPEALKSSGRLSNTAGSVLDPIVAIRLRVVLAPDESTSVDFVTGIALTREAATLLIDKYQDRHLTSRVLEMAWTHGQVLLRQLNATEGDAQLYGRMASSIIHVNPAQRAPPTLLAKNLRGQSGLWGHSISGDLPIVLLRIGRIDKLELARQLVQAHAYWRLKGLAVDLVIWNDGDVGYRQELQDSIISLGSASTDAPRFDRPGGLFIRRTDQLSEDDRILLQAVSRVIITDSEGTLTEQVNRQIHSSLRIPKLIPGRTRLIEAPQESHQTSPKPDLRYFNGLGGFTQDGREYVIRLAPGQVCPAPWVNVLANSHF